MAKAEAEAYAQQQSMPNAQDEDIDPKKKAEMALPSLKLESQRSATSVKERQVIPMKDFSVSSLLKSDSTRLTLTTHNAKMS